MTRRRTLRAAVPPDRRALLAAYAAICVIWGTTFLAIKVAQRWLPPFTLSGVQTTTSGLLMLAWLRARGARRPDRAALTRGLIGGMLFFLLGNGGVFFGIGRIPSGLAALLVGSIPVFSLLLEWGLGWIAPGRGMVAGLACAATGLAWLVMPGTTAAPDPVGVICCLFGSLMWAVGGLAMKRLPARGPALESPALQNLLGGLLSLGAGRLLGEWAAVDGGAFGPVTAGALGYLMAFGSVVAFSLYTWLVTVWSPSRVTSYAFINPVVALFVGWALGGETVTLRTLAAAAIIIAGVALITLSPAGETFRPSAGSNRKTGGAPASANARQGGRHA